MTVIFPLLSFKKSLPPKMLTYHGGKKTSQPVAVEVFVVAPHYL